MVGPAKQVKRGTAARKPPARPGTACTIGGFKNQDFKIFFIQNSGAISTLQYASAGIINKTKLKMLTKTNRETVTV